MTEPRNDGDDPLATPHINVIEYTEGTYSINVDWSSSSHYENVYEWDTESGNIISFDADSFDRIVEPLVVHDELKQKISKIEYPRDLLECINVFLYEVVEFHAYGKKLFKALEEKITATFLDHALKYFPYCRFQCDTTNNKFDRFGRRALTENIIILDLIFDDPEEKNLTIRFERRSNGSSYFENGVR